MRDEVELYVTFPMARVAYMTPLGPNQYRP